MWRHVSLQFSHPHRPSLKVAGEPAHINLNTSSSFFFVGLFKAAPNYETRCQAAALSTLGSKLAANWEQDYQSVYILIF